MSPFRSIFLPITLLAAGILLNQNAGAQEAHPSDLTANELAEVLSIHWWFVKLPGDIGPKDMTSVVLVSSDGKTLAGGGGFTGLKPGEVIKIFCWEDKVRNTLVVSMRTKEGGSQTPYENYFKDAATGGPSNGSVLKEGDTLLKFDTSKNRSFTGGNDLSAGQVGLKVETAKSSN